MRAKKKYRQYKSSWKGQKYPSELRVMHLAYRGNQYRLKDGILQVNVDKLIGKPKYVKGMINLNLDKVHDLDLFTDKDAVAHICGYISSTQFNLKKGLKLFGEPDTKAVDASNMIKNC